MRLHPGILMGVRDGVIWVCGETLDESVEIELRKLAIERYEVVDRDRLRPLHSGIVMGRLPSFEARPLRDWLQLDMPAPAYAGLATGKAVLSPDTNVGGTGAGHFGDRHG